MFTGVLLSLVTFAFAVAIIVALGLPWAGIILRRAPISTYIRHSLWWGLLVLSVLGLLLNQVLPLADWRVPIVIGVACVVSAVAGIAVVIRCPRRVSFKRPTASVVFLLSSLGITVLVLALRVVGPVTNYDTGLYHLGAIRYAEDFAAIPGLANLFFAYGYATSQWPLAGLLSWSPLGLEGFRALNSIVFILLASDLAVRVLRREKKAGTYVAGIGTAVIAFTMLPLGDYWVVSPTQDSHVLVLVVASSAYLSDVLSRQKWVPSAATAVAIVTSTVLVRSTMVAYAAVVALVVVFVAIRRRRDATNRQARAAAGVAAVWVILAVASGALRDYRLSGWWQYPLSLVAFDVDWRATDATPERLATLGAARDPANPWAAADSWSWIGSWISRALSTWETYAALLLIVAGVMGVLVTRPPRRMLLALLPSLVATTFWFLFTPPSFRFAWGPVFTLGVIPLGWSLWQWSRTRDWVATISYFSISAVIALACMLTVFLRIDFAESTSERTSRWVPVEFAVVDVARVPTTELEVDSRLRLLMPTTGDQCWDAYPLCTPQPKQSLRLRGAGIGEGLRR